MDSAGTHPAIPISEAAKTYLARETAKPYLKSEPEGLDRKDLSGYDLIVVMKAAHQDAVLKQCPQCASRVVVWDVDDPYFLPHGYAEKIFNQIKAKVAALAETL